MKARRQHTISVVNEIPAQQIRSAVLCFAANSLLKLSRRNREQLKKEMDNDGTVDVENNNIITISTNMIWIPNM